MPVMPTEPEPPAMVTCSDGSTAESQDVCDQRTMAATAAARAMAAKIAPAIADPDGDGMITGANQTDLQKDMRPGAVAAITVADGGAVTVDHDGASATDIPVDTLDKIDMMEDPDDDTKMVPVENQFMPQMTAPPALDGFAGSVHERIMDKTTDTLTVYTNVEAAKDEAYQMYYETNTADDRGASIASIANNDEGNVITFAADVSAISMRISAQDFQFGTKVTKNLMADNADTATEDESEIEGSFHGIPGTYSCDGDTCTVSTDEDGNVASFDVGTWTFTPSEAGAKMMVQGASPDSDFLTFGYWMQAEEDDEGETTYGINTFATGAEPFAAASTVQGSATYSGKATGMYVKKTFNDRGVGTPSSSGQFTADTSLTATFGQTTAQHPDGADTVVPNLANSITGTVSNFMDASGNSIDNAWSVTLNKASIGTTGSIGVGTNPETHPATTTGGGSWVGQLYGPTVLDDSTTTDVNESLAGYPTGVAGEFNGHFVNGHVIGAFGATQDKKE